MENKCERALIASILNQAILDSVLHKHPRSPQILSLEYLDDATKKKVTRIMRIYLLNMLANIKLYRKKKKKRVPIGYLNLLITICNFIKLINKKERKDESISWDARQFLNKRNKLFCFYCWLLDIDPEYMYEKVKKYHHDYDRGLCGKIYYYLSTF